MIRNWIKIKFKVYKAKKLVKKINNSFTKHDCDDMFYLESWDTLFGIWNNPPLMKIKELDDTRDERKQMIEELRELLEETKNDDK